MTFNIRCKVLGHIINRKRVWDDGQNDRSRCETCHQPVIRDKGVWRAFVVASDLNVKRRMHPHTDEIA